MGDRGREDETDPALIKFRVYLSPIPHLYIYSLYTIYKLLIFLNFLIFFT